MRSGISGTLDTAQNSRNYKPTYRVTIRDMLLRFAAFTTQSNPYSAQDSSVVGSDNGVYGDQIVTPGGKILRVLTDGSTLYVNRATPGTAASWGTWNAVGGISLYHNMQPGLVTSSTDIYLFYFTNTFALNWVKSTDDGVTWSTATTTGLSFAVGATVAPITKDLVYVCQLSGSGVNTSLGVTRCVNSSGWTSTTMPFSLYGNNDLTQTSWLTSGSSYFDAVQLNGVDYLFLSDSSRGVGWTLSYSAGCWSQARWLLPADYTYFVPYRATVIQGRIWLTGRVTRNNITAFSPAFDCYIYSDNGTDWTALSRNSYLGTTEMRGKLHLPGDGYVYYSGIYTVQRAPASYLIDPAGDLAANKLVLGDTGGEINDLISCQVEYPSAGSAPQMELEVKNDDDGYLTGSKSAIVKPASEIWVEAGYQTTAGREMIQIAHGSIDSPDLAIADGSRRATFSARDIIFKNLKDWNSPFYIDLSSQFKFRDPCTDTNNFSIQPGGEFNNNGPNLVLNPSFEVDLLNWTSYAIGSPATGTRTRSQVEKTDGLWSYRMEKQTGTDASQFGAGVTFTGVAGHTYHVSMQVNIASMLGGNLTYTLKSSGNYGVAGAAASDSVTFTDVTSTFVEMTLDINVQTGAGTPTITVRVYMDNCTTGTMYIDSVSIRQTDSQGISTNDQDGDQIMLSSQPAMDDFDIRAELSDTATAAAQIAGMGLIGLAVDNNNFIYLQLAHYGTTKVLELWKRRNGAWTKLATTPFTWATDGTHYSMRLVHRGGHFWGWVKATATAAWGAAQIDYTWTSTTDKPCNSSDGKGRVGYRGVIYPYRFHAYGVDQYSTLICLRGSNDLDWNNIPSSGTLLFETEQITYANKTGSGTVDVARTFDSAAACNLNACGPNSASPECHFVQSPYTWAGYVGLALNGTPADSAFNNYGLVFTAGSEPNAAWLITSFIGNYGGKSYLTTADSGHGNTNGLVGGDPYWHTFGGASPACQITPAIYNCTRGVNGTQAAPHTDGLLCYVFADDTLRIHSFDIFDMNEDYSNESIIRRMCAFAGVTSTSFNIGPVAPTLETTTNNVNWSQFYVYTSPNATAQGLNFDLSCTITALGSGEGVGVGVCGGQAMLTLEYNSGVYSLNLYDGFGTPLFESQVPFVQPAAGVGLNLRFVVVGNWATVYINKMLAGAFCLLGLSSPPNYPATQLYVVLKGASLTMSNIYVPDLSEWREFAQVNNGEDILSAFGRVLADRPIWLISRSGESLKAATFTSRDVLGTFSDTIFLDEQSRNDNEVFSWARVETADIIEQVDDTISRTYGLLHRSTSMPEVLTPGASIMMGILLRRSQETAYGQTEQMIANVGFENEDKFTVSYTASGTGTAIPTANMPTSLIVNDVSYHIAEANFEMQVSARKWVS